MDTSGSGLSTCRKLSDMISEFRIEQRSRPDVLKMSESLFPGKPEVGEGCSRNKTGSVQSHETVDEDRMSIAHQARYEHRESVKLRLVRELIIVDGEIDVQNFIRDFGHPDIDVAIHIDDRVDTLCLHQRPIVDVTRDEQSIC